MPFSTSFRIATICSSLCLLLRIDLSPSRVWFKGNCHLCNGATLGEQVSCFSRTSRSYRHKDTLLAARRGETIDRSHSVATTTRRLRDLVGRFCAYKISTRAPVETIRCWHLRRIKILLAPTIASAPTYTTTQIAQPGQVRTRDGSCTKPKIF